MNALVSFIRKDDGAALVEYAVLLALLAICAMFFISSVGIGISNKFSSVETQL
jgi:Flp pilus assembly pilin Flp